LVSTGAASVTGNSELGFSCCPGVGENASITELGDSGGESDFGSDFGDDGA
jgi:hypothetical protein